jgi:hypothetical protein
MDYEDIVKRLAPCGLDCARCADYDKGEIKELSLKLSSLLRNYGRVAKLKSDGVPAFANYPQFEEILTLLSNGSCGGCRSENLRCPIDCRAPTCHKEKGVDFCFQCSEYPCENPTDRRLIDRWKQRNDRMKEIGVVQFYEEQSKLPRY